MGEWLKAGVPLEAEVSPQWEMLRADVCEGGDLFSCEVLPPTQKSPSTTLLQMEAGLGKSDETHSLLLLDGGGSAQSIATILSHPHTIKSEPRYHKVNSNVNTAKHFLLLLV